MLAFPSLPILCYNVRKSFRKGLSYAMIVVETVVAFISLARFLASMMTIERLFRQRFAKSR